MLDPDLVGIRLGVEETNRQVTVGPLDRLNRQQREVEEPSHVGAEFGRGDRPGFVEGGLQVDDVVERVAVDRTIEDRAPRADGIGRLAPDDLVERLDLDGLGWQRVVAHDDGSDDEGSRKRSDHAPLTQGEVHRRHASEAGCPSRRWAHRPTAPPS